MPSIRELRLKFYHARRALKRRLLHPETRGGRGVAIGRAAAVSAVDAGREQLLADLLGRELAVPGDLVGVIGDDATVDLLSGFSYVRLHPGTCLAVARAQRPTVLLIDENAFESGNWYGSLSTAGESLFADVSALTDFAAEACAMVVGIRRDTPLQTHTPALRQRYTQTVPLVAAERPHDIPVDPLLRALDDRVRERA